MRNLFRLAILQWPALCRFLLWPAFLLARIATEPSAVLEFSAGLTAVLFSIALSFDTRSSIAIVLKDIAPMTYWSWWLFIAGSLQMYCCAYRLPSVRSQVTAGCGVLWIMIGGLFAMEDGIAGVEGLLAGNAFICGLSVYMHARKHRHEHGPQP